MSCCVGRAVTAMAFREEESPCGLEKFHKAMGKAGFAQGRMERREGGVSHR